MKEGTMTPPVGRAMVAGFVGTVAITLMMYFVAPMMTGQPMDIAAMLGSMLGGSWIAGMVLHFVNGTVIFPLIYTAVLYHVLPGGPVVKGLIWGAVLWLLAQILVMPMMGGGFFSANAGGMPAVIGSLMGHLVYGLLLGALAGEPKRIEN
jgi:uncharacterized membrane protein YagU involved in acid resistance